MTDHANETAVHAALRDEYGLDAHLYNTGGGCMVFEATLENGDIMCITEAEDFISPYEWRINGLPNRYTGEIMCEGESAGRPWGWMVGIYHPDPEYPGCREEMPYAGVIDHAAFFADLVRCVAESLDCAVASKRTGEPVFLTTGSDGVRVRSTDIWGG